MGLLFLWTQIILMRSRKPVNSCGNNVPMAQTTIATVVNQVGTARSPIWSSRLAHHNELMFIIEYISSGKRDGHVQFDFITLCTDCELDAPVNYAHT